MPEVSVVSAAGDVEMLVDADGQGPDTHLVDVRTGQVRQLGTGADLARWSPDGRSLYYFRFLGAPDGGREGEIWSVVEGRLVDGALVDERTVLDRDDLDDTILADVGLHPAFSLAVGPCG